MFKVMKNNSMFKVMMNNSMLKVMKNISMFKVMKNISMFKVIKNNIMFKVMKNNSKLYTYKVDADFVVISFAPVLDEGGVDGEEEGEGGRDKGLVQALMILKKNYKCCGPGAGKSHITSV
jgi:hypothetical protein